MDNIWGRLSAFTVRLETEKTSRNTDKEISEQLNAGFTDGDLSAFYLAVRSVEIGCGFQQMPELIEACSEALRQDSEKLLCILEQKTRMIDVLMFLLCVDKTTKLDWLKNNKFSKSAILFECLRQILKDDKELLAEETKIVATGLVRLAVLAPQYFRRLIQHNQFKEFFAPILVSLWEELSDDGWTEYGKAISFADFDPQHIQYIDRCLDKLNNRDTLGNLQNKAYPIVEGWLTYMEAQRQKQKFGQSIYNNYSNLLITIMICHLNKYTKFIKLFERTICECEADLYSWYESEIQQRSVLYVHLSIIVHLRFVWENNEPIYKADFPEGFRIKTKNILVSYQHLWDCNTDNQYNMDAINQLQSWLNTGKSISK